MRTRERLRRRQFSHVVCRHVSLAQRLLRKAKARIIVLANRNRITIPPSIPHSQLAVSSEHCASPVTHTEECGTSSTILNTPFSKNQCVSSKETDALNTLVVPLVDVPDSQTYLEGLKVATINVQGKWKQNYKRIAYLF